MSSSNRIGLVSGLKLFLRVLADRLQHGEARFAVLLVLAKQALIEQLGKTVHNLDSPGTDRGTDFGRGCQREASSEHSEPPKDGSRLLVQQFEAPGDRGAQRALPLWPVSGGPA